MLLKDERQKAIVEETRPFLHEHLLLLTCKFIEEYDNYFAAEKDLQGIRSRFQRCSDDLIKWLKDFKHLKEVRNKLIAHSYRYPKWDKRFSGQSIFDTGYYKELKSVPDGFQHINEIADIMHFINDTLIQLYDPEIAHYQALLPEGENKEDTVMDYNRDGEFVMRLEKFKGCLGTEEK